MWRAPLTEIWNYVWRCLVVPKEESETSQKHSSTCMQDVLTCQTVSSHPKESHWGANHTHGRFCIAFWPGVILWCSSSVRNKTTTLAFKPALVDISRQLNIWMFGGERQWCIVLMINRWLGIKTRARQLVEETSRIWAVLGPTRKRNWNKIISKRANKIFVLSEPVFILAWRTSYFEDQNQWNVLKPVSWR